MQIFNQTLSQHESEEPDLAQLNRLALPFDERQRSRLRIIIEHGPLAGESAGIDMPRGTLLRGGTLLTDEQGHMLRIDAAPEALLELRSDSARNLTALAYHLGNRHVAVQIGPAWLRLQADHVLEQMVRGLGAEVRAVKLPFEPEGGAYRSSAHAPDHHHDHQHDHPHDHDHNHDQNHDHEHHQPHTHPRPHWVDNVPAMADARPNRSGAGHHGDRAHAPRIHDLSDPSGREKP